jgi:TonB family protein
MNKNKNRVKGIIGTILFHALLLATLIIFALSTPLPLPGEEGVEVNLGSSDLGTGLVQEEEPAERVQENKPPPPPPPEEEVIDEKIITQEVEEAPVVQEERIEKREERREIEKEHVEPIEEVVEEEPVEQEPEPEPPKVDPRAMYKGKSTDNKGADQGLTGQPGDQGKPDGDPDVNTYDGQGGAGDGIGFDLGGRGAKYLHKPTYSSEEQGRIKVEIRVNRNGKVVRAKIAKGTNIADTKLQNQAISAALKSTFQPDPNAPEIQIGTITYNFIRIN